jgi:tetratricopeptide (TPR) repeat protein
MSQFLGASGEVPLPESSNFNVEKDAAKALAAKEEGNTFFRNKDYDMAIEFYSQAINLCPDEGIEVKAARETEGQDKPGVDASYVDKEEAGSRTVEESEAAKMDARLGSVQAQDYSPPSKNAEMLATFLSNRAACFAAVGEWDMVVDDCNWALDLHPRYTKVLIRRSQAYEHLEKTEEALEDLRAVQAIDPSWPKIAQSVERVEAAHKKRLDDIKDEALGKLKELGNSILGNFGMSLDQFNFQQDPKTGAWSMGNTGGSK